MSRPTYTYNVLAVTSHASYIATQLRDVQDAGDLFAAVATLVRDWNSVVRPSMATNGGEMPVVRLFVAETEGHGVMFEFDVNGTHVLLVQ